MLPSSPVLRPFRLIRQALPWLLALAVATCTADQGGPSSSGTGYFSFRPVYHLAGGASLSQFGIVADSVRIRLTRPVNQVVLDTALFFPPDSTSLHLALPVELLQSPETLTAVITISAGGAVIFRDSIEAEVKDGPAGSSTPPTVTFNYVGPGSNIASISILPPDTNVFFGDTLFFIASAIDSSDATVASFYTSWKTSDTTVAKINANGRFIAPAVRGSVRVIGMTPTGIADTTLVAFSPVPVIVTADSGNAQSGLAGDSLAALFVARVKGADSLGIAGIPVKFAAVTAGGAVRDTITLITDATGRVRTRGVLGTVAGPYSYTATAVGTALPVATFTGSAGSAAAAAISIAQGNGQVDTIGKTLALPLGVNVRDAFGNQVGGAMVIFTRTAGSGTVGSDTVLTAVDGDASTAYTLGPVAGTDSIKAQLAGTSAFVVFTATAVSNTPSSIIQGLGGGQSAIAGTAFTDSLTVQVLDINDNPIAGAQVHWAVTLGSALLSADSTPTDAAGHTGIAVTAGTAVGPVTIAATVTGIASPVNFSEAVTPAAPAAISLVSGNGQSANALGVLPLPLVVHVVDGFGNPVPGVTVAFTVTAGAGTIDSATATTDIVGNANSGSWSLGAVAGVNTVIATSAAVPADTVTFTATGLPAGTNKVWTAAINNAWNLAGNWSPSGIPTVSDNVFVPAAPPSPVIPATTSINDLTIESGATVTLAAITLTVTGNADIAGTLAGTGTVALNGTGKTVRGSFTNASVNSTGTLTLNGPTTVNSAFTLGAGSLTVGGQTLTLNNGLTVNGSGVLVMTNAADSVDVFGNATFSSGTSSTGSLTNGVIVYHGNFTQTGGAFTNYSADPGHRTRFFAFTLQTISFTNPSPANSHFGSVEFANGVGEVLASNIAATGTVLVTGANVTGSGRTAFLTGDLISPPANWFLTTTEWSVAPTLYPDSILGSLNVVAPWTLSHALEVGGNLTVNTGGTLTVGGQALRVVGALNVTSNGQLAMDNAADSVDVGGTATFNSGTSGTGLLSAGVLVLRGDFTQTAGAFTNFAPSGTHRTRFLGTTGQTITFSTPGSANSRFQDLEFGDPAGITLASTVTAMGPTTVTAGTVTGIGRTINLGGDLVATYANWQVSTTLWGASPTVYPDSLSRNVTVFNGFTLNKPFKVDSNLIINSTGVLTLNGNALRVGGSFTQGGVLRMQNTADTLVIGGLFTVNSGISGVGDLTGGILRLRGGMSQSAGAFANFQPAGSHITRFEAGTGQSLSFTTSGAANSRFQNLELADSVNASSNLYVAGDVTVLTGGKLVGAPTMTLAGNLTDPTNAGWRASNTLLSGTPTFLPDSMVTNLQLSGTWTVGRRTAVDGNMTVNAGGVLALNADTVRVTGAFTQAGALTMASPSDLLDIGGLFTVNSATSGTGQLSDGRMILRNGFSQTAGSFTNFAPSGNHTVRFAGTGGHGVNFTTPSAANSRFQNLEVLDSLTLTTAMTVMGSTTLDPAGRMMSAASTATLNGDLVDPSKKGWRVANTSVPGTQALPDTMATNLTVTGNWTLATPIDLTGNFNVAGTGIVALNGHRMHVSGNVTQGGRLQMLQAPDTLDVGGDLLVNSAQTGVGDMVDGRLVLHGAFTQTAGSFTNFAPSASHLTAFVGTGGHGVSFTTPDNATQSHFHQLEVRDSLAVTGIIAASGAVTVDSVGRVAGIGTAKLLGALVDSSLAGWRMGTTQLDGHFQSIPSALVSNVVLTDSIALAQQVTVTGNFTMQNAGYIAFGGHGLGVSGNFTQSAHLAMNSTGDSLEVGGNFLVNSASADTMTVGVIVLHGSFTQTAGSFTNYVSVAPHRTRFTGAAARSIDFTTPTQSMFGDLEVDATGTITLGGNFRVTGTFKKPAGPVSPFTAVAQRLLQVNGLAVDGASFDRVRIQLNSNVNAMQFDNVAFTNQDLTQTQLSLELPGLAGDTLKLNSVAFDGVPTTGHYVLVTDSVPDGAVATVAFYNSTPLNGSLFAAVNGAAGDVPSVLWSSLQWQTQPLAGTELLPFVPAPQLKAVDPSGSLLTGFTGTVTLGLSTDPSAGTAVLGNNSVAAVGGIATFDSLTLSLAGVGYRLQANAGSLGQSPPSAPFDITVPLPVGTTTAFNNGGGDNNWFNAANWTAGVPDSADNVFVFPGQTATVNAPARANKLVVGTGGDIVLNATLAVDSSIAAGNTITGGGQLVAQGTGTLSGVVGDLLVTGNYVVPTGGHLSATTITIDNIGVLDPGADTITVTDSLRTLTAGILNMTGGTAVVDIGGNALFNGGQSTLNGGLLRLHKGLTSAHDFAVTFTPASNIAFVGTGTQLVSYAVADSNNALGNIAFTGDTLRFVTNAWVGGSTAFNAGVTVIDSTLFTTSTVGGTGAATLAGNILWIRNAITFAGTYSVGTTVFAGTGVTIPALATPYDTVWVSGGSLLGGTVAANVFYVVTGGSFDLAGHRLNVTTDFGTSGDGRFAMTSAADSLFVGGTFYAMGGSTAGLLTNGLVEITGSFYQGGIPNSIPAETTGPPPALDAYRATVGHTTRFVGTAAPRTIFFGSPVLPADPFSTANSSFGRLELIDGTDSVASTLPVNADLLVDSARVVNLALTSGGPAVAGNVQVGPNVPEFTISNVSLGGVLDFQPAPALYQVGTTLFFGNAQSVPVLPYQGIEVDLGQATLSGDLTVQNVRTGVASEGPGFPGDLKLGGHKLTVTGNFTTVGQGTFTMDNIADSLDVSGNMDLGGGVTTALTAGTLVARGDLYLGDSTFVASGTHHTVFAAPSSQQLWIQTSPTPSDQFAFLTVLAGTTVNFNAFQVGPLVVADTFAINGFFVQAAAGKTVIALGDLYAGTAAGLTVDTVELHKSLDIDASTYSTQLTRYAGTGQIVSRTTSYNDLEITGTAALDSTVTVNRDVSVRGNGVLDVAGHTLAVARDLTVADSGLLRMTSPADSVNVGYTATFDGRDSDGWLTAGTLTFNYFKQLATGSPNSFRATGTHRAVLLQQNPADLTEMVQFATPGATASQFQEFELSGGSLYAYFGAGTIYVADSLYVPAGGSSGLFGSGTTIIVNGPIAVQTGTIPIQIDTLELRGTIQVPYSSLSNGVTRFAGVNQQIPDTQSYNRIEVTGTASLETGGGDVAASDVAITGNGHLTLGNLQQLTSNGPFSTSGNGTLTMNDPTSALFVNGTATFGGGSTAGQLTAGTLSILGDLTQSNATSDSSFHPAIGHRTLFTGSRRHTIALATPDLNYGANFGDLEVTAYDTLDINGGHPVVFGHTLLDPTAALVDAPYTGTFAALGPFTAGAFGTINVHDTDFRDSVTVDPTVVYNVLYTGYNFYTLPIPSLNYTNLVFQNGSPSLGASINATGFVGVNGTQFAGGGGTPMTLAFNGHTLTTSAFGTGSYGAIVMDQPGDSLIVGGAAQFQGQSELGKLTAGYIRFGGDLSTDTVSGGAPSAFVTEGTVVDLALDVPHNVKFFDPDSSYLPALLPSGAGTLNLQVQGRARVAGDINAYGLTLTGDTLEVDSTLTGGPAGAFAGLKMLRTGHIYGGTTFSTYAVGTTQFTAPDYLLTLPYDTLVVSDTLRGSYSQLVNANYLEVTGPGNPRHAGNHAGWLYLQGGDGNTTINVAGNILVSGKFATIYSNFGTLSSTGNLDVMNDGLLVSNVGGCCGTSLFDVGGNATFNGASTKDSLTGGQLVIGGNFTQGGPDPESFVADSGFTTTFSGTGTHKAAFATPSAAGGGGSHFGSLSFSAVDPSLVLTTDTDLWVEGTLTTSGYMNDTLRSTAGALRTLTVRDVSIQGITFDHLQLHLQKTGLPAAGTGNMDIVNFQNFLTTENQFLVDLPGQPGGFTWSNFTFKQLSTDTLALDSGHYIVANDIDGGTPDILRISLGGSQINDPLTYFEALGGAVITPFAP